MKKAIVLAVILLLAGCLLGSTSVMPAIEKVLGVERPTDVDILLLRNGDRLTGTVRNESISMRTSYAHVEIPTKYIAGINLEGGAINIEAIITVNNNRFSGFIDDPSITFELTSGVGLEIRREKILTIVFRQRPEETAGMQWKQFIQLKNGDFFHGKILNENIYIATTYARIPLDYARTESITLIGDMNPLTTVRMLNGDTVQGILETEDIEIDLDVGGKVEVYQDRIDKIFFIERYIPDYALYGRMLTRFADLVLVEGGTFTMGDTWGTGRDNERPTHRVTLSYNYYIGQNEVTFDEYDRFCEETGRTKPDDEGWGRGQRPVINVSWWDAIAYCNWLSDKEGLSRAYDDKGNFLDANGRTTTDPSKVVGYRLPTEAEWEFAARGGNSSKGYEYAGSDDVDDVAWYWRNSGDRYLTGDWDRDRINANNCRTQEVGTKLANELGIHDMSGNVWEWCSDWYADYTSTAKTNPYNAAAGSNRVIRGGRWRNDASSVRVAYRNVYSPTNTLNGLGFRITRTVH